MKPTQTPFDDTTTNPIEIRANLAFNLHALNAAANRRFRSMDDGNRITSNREVSVLRSSILVEKANLRSACTV